MAGMEWQAVVLAIQILLLAAGWILFQRARGELSAQAAEMPVLSEVKALQHRVKLLLAELQSATDRQAERLENGCADALAVLTEIENKIQVVEALISRSERAAQRAGVLSAGAADSSGDQGAMFGPQDVIVDSRLLTTDTNGDTAVLAEAASAPAGGREGNSRESAIYALADRGLSASAIAHEMRLSEGEIEILLGLRDRRS